MSFNRPHNRTGRFKWRGAFSAWLYKSRKCDRRSSTKDLAKRAHPTDKQITEPDLEAVERRAQLFQAVDRLPEDQRRVIVMRFADEKSIRDIAGALGRSEGAIKQLQFRGLETLRARLAGKVIAAE
jgi:RNA polymerase sigma-70 factor (ECF subfamily)